MSPAEITTPPTTPIDSPPLDREVACPLCNYDLRAQTQPRCPECGYKFEWSQILDPRVQKHPYLFEHHPNVRGYFRTLIGGLWPWTFWRTMHPLQVCSAPRPILYHIISILLVTPAVFTLSFMEIFRFHYHFPYYGNPRPDLWGMLSLSWSQFSRMPLEYLLLTPCILAAWPLTTFLSLLIFQATLRRKKLRAVHLMRCTVYSWDWAVYASLLLIVTSALQLLCDWLDVEIGTLGLTHWLKQNAIGWLVLIRVPLEALSPKRKAKTRWRTLILILNTAILTLILASNMDAGFFLAGIGATLFFYRLTVALSAYLQFPSPFLTALASQIIVALIALNIYFALTIW